MKNKVLTVAAVSLLTACAGFKPDYEVKDASETSKPAWTVQSKTAKIDSSAERKTNRYYVSDGMEKFISFADDVLSCHVNSAEVVDIEAY